MPRVKPTSMPRSRASRFAELALACAALLATSARALADDAVATKRARRDAVFDDGAWGRDEVELPNLPRSTHTGHPEGWAHGFGLGVGPASPVSVWAAFYSHILIYADDRQGRRVRFGGSTHIHGGLGLTQMDRVDPTRDRWIAPFCAGAEPAWAFVGAHGVYFRVGVDFRLEVRRRPARFAASPRLALGVIRDGGSFELGVGYEPFIDARLASGATSWDHTERATVIFIRVGTGVRR